RRDVGERGATRRRPQRGEEHLLQRGGEHVRVQARDPGGPGLVAAGAQLGGEVGGGGVHLLQDVVDDGAEHRAAGQVGHRRGGCRGEPVAGGDDDVALVLHPGGLRLAAHALGVGGGGETAVGGAPPGVVQGAAQVRDGQRG